jgi:hypothetical protein
MVSEFLGIVSELPLAVLSVPGLWLSLVPGLSLVAMADGILQLEAPSEVVEVLGPE